MELQSSTMDSTASSYQTPPPQPHNPYARIPSRRAIACVTCAKAKTKCDKGLPSCSRCVTKGIKCDPRSTRRTSENNYRASVKKPFVSPKRYNSTSAISTLGRHSSSPRSIPSSNRQRVMRAASHIDFRTAVKMSQQASGLSGLPMLTPLPTYSSQIVDECYSYSSSPEQNMNGFPRAMEHNNFPSSGPLTPQTPQSILYSEPSTTGEHMDPYMSSPTWSDHFVATGLGFGPEITALMPTEVWGTNDTELTMPIPQMSWSPSSISVSPQQMTAELIPHSTGVPSLATSECSVDDFNVPVTGQDDWTMYQPSHSQISMAGLVSSAPFAQDMKLVAANAPMWQDVYMPGSMPY